MKPAGVGMVLVVANVVRVVETTVFFSVDVVVEVLVSVSNPNLASRVMYQCRDLTHQYSLW